VEGLHRSEIARCGAHHIRGSLARPFCATSASEREATRLLASSRVADLGD
jgi:hypothetical protein